MTYTLWDYKRTSVWAVLHGPKPDWVAQMNIYRYLLALDEKKVTHLKIIAELRDWQKSRVKGDYPATSIITLDVPLWDIAYARGYLLRCVADHQADIPRPCTDAERWTKPTIWAVHKKGRKTAVKLCDSQESADAMVERLGAEHYVDVRLGEAVRCEQGYCPVAQWCPQRKRENEH